MASSLSVLIPTAGDRLDLLKRSLESLAKCDRPSIYRETVIIENGGKRGVEDIVRPFTASLDARYLFDPMGNKSNALNTALKSMGEGLIILLDDDVRLSPGVLQDYAKAAHGMESGLFFGGPCEVDFEVPPPAWLLPHLPSSARGWRLEPGQVLGQRCFLGFNWAAFAGDLRRAGGFDPARGPGAAIPSQETEMQERLRRHGNVGRYVPDALVWHYVAADRCTPQWVVKRHHRRCVGKIAEMPAGVKKQCMTRMKASGRRLAAMAYHLAALTGSPRMAFLAQLQFAMASGMIAGLSYRRPEGPEFESVTQKK